MNADDVLNAVLLPLQAERLLLPSVAIADAIPASGLRPATVGAPDWLAGWISWQDLDLPVLQVERLLGAADAPAGTRPRVVILHPAGSGAGLPRLGLLCDGHPQLLSLSRAALEALPVQSGDRTDLLLMRVRADGRDALVPDLDALEAQLAALLDDTAGP